MHISVKEYFVSIITCIAYLCNAFLKHILSYKASKAKSTACASKHNCYYSKIKN